MRSETEFSWRFSSIAVQQGNDLAPQIGPGRLAVDEDYRIAVQSLSERAGADFAQARSNGLRLALGALATMQKATESPPMRRL